MSTPGEDYYCDACEAFGADRIGCGHRFLREADGARVGRVRYGRDTMPAREHALIPLPTEPCPDCGAHPDHHHHAGCINDWCPLCLGEIVCCTRHRWEVVSR